MSFQYLVADSGGEAAVFSVDGSSHAMLLHVGWDDSLLVDYIAHVGMEMTIGGDYEFIFSYWRSTGIQMKKKHTGAAKIHQIYFPGSTGREFFWR